MKEEQYKHTNFIMDIFLLKALRYCSFCGWLSVGIWGAILLTALILFYLT